MRNRLLCACLMLLAVLHATSQSNSMLRRQAILAERNKDWYSAAQYYQRLVSGDSTNLKVRYAYAEASRLALDNEVALRVYLSVAAVDNGRRFPLAFYWIGHALKTKGNYRAAKLWFTKFYKLKNRQDDLAHYRKRARQEEENCDYAQILKNAPLFAKLDHLDQNVNTRNSEMAPFEMDSALYFSSVRAPDKRDPSMPDPLVFSKIYRSNIRKERYQKIRAMDTLINANLRHNSGLTYSPSRDYMVISRCNMLNASDFACDLYASRLVSRRWSVPMKMEAPLNVEGFSTSQPHLAVIDSHLVLFFSSNRPGGEGGMDIWYARGQKDGTFAAPVNAGSSVNSPEDEVSPWFVGSERTLYFSSTYHPGLGNFDVFRSPYGPSGFATASNVGYPVNSGHNDLYYSVNEDAKRVYLSSNRTGAYGEQKSNCCNDIYMFRYDTIVPPPVIDTSLVRREKMKLLVPLTLFFHNDEPDPKTTNTVTTKSYDSLYAGYQRMTHQYEQEFSTGLKGDQKQLANDAITNFFEDSVSNSMQELRKFVDLMKPLLAGGDTIRITMKGYCSPLASTNYNRNLARRRISSLRNYFMRVDNGHLAQYVNNTEPGKGMILFEDVDIGELKVSKASDNFRDRRNSVYSPYAAAERKIQIIAVSFGGR